MRSSGLSVRLCNADEDPDLMRECTFVLRRQRVDGMIVAPSATARESLQTVQDAAIPLVFVDRAIPGMGVPAVVSDISAAITEAIRPPRRRGADGWASSPVLARPPPVGSAWPSSPPRRQSTDSRRSCACPPTPPDRKLGFPPMPEANAPLITLEKVSRSFGPVPPFALSTREHR